MTQNVRMRPAGHSTALGARPDWVAAASEVRLVGYGEQEEMEAHFELPELGAAAEEMYRQQELWPTRPFPGDTGLDLVADVVEDIAADSSVHVRDSHDRHLFFFIRTQRYQSVADSAWSRSLTYRCILDML